MGTLCQSHSLSKSDLISFAHESSSCSCKQGVKGEMHLNNRIQVQ